MRLSCTFVVAPVSCFILVQNDRSAVLLHLWTHIPAMSTVSSPHPQVQAQLLFAAAQLLTKHPLCSKRACVQDHGFLESNIVFFTLVSFVQKDVISTETGIPSPNPA